MSLMAVFCLHAGSDVCTWPQRRVTMDMRHILTAAVGHSLWVGPSQAQTPGDRVGVYVKGYVPPGTVVVGCVTRPRRVMFLSSGPVLGAGHVLGASVQPGDDDAGVGRWAFS